MVLHAGNRVFCKDGHGHNHYSFHTARADLLRRLGRSSEAAAASKQAAALASSDAERDFLTRAGKAVG